MSLVSEKCPTCGVYRSVCTCDRCETQLGEEPFIVLVHLAGAQKEKHFCQACANELTKVGIELPPKPVPRTIGVMRG